MPPQRRSLGACLYGFPPASGHAAAEQEAPGPWLDEFVAHHADATVFSGLFTSCRAGRDLVLTRAPQFTLQLKTSKNQSARSSQWSKQLAAVNSALTTRAQYPTTLVLTCDSTPHSTSALQLIASKLTGAPQGVHKLSLVGPAHQYSQVGGFVLKPLASALPHLTSLSLHHCTCSLPNPAHLPCLTHLTVTLPPPQDDSTSSSGTDSDSSDDSAADLPQMVPAHDLFRSVAPYTTQLTSLKLLSATETAENDEGVEEVADPVLYPWPLLFPAATSTLTTLSVAACLCDTLLGLLLDRVQQLALLQCHEPAMEADIHRDRQWAIESLTIVLDSEYNPTLGVLTGLPRSTATPVDVEFRDGPAGSRLELIASGSEVRRFGDSHCFCSIAS